MTSARRKPPGAKPGAPDPWADPTPAPGPHHRVELLTLTRRGAKVIRSTLNLPLLGAVLAARHLRWFTHTPEKTP